MKEQQIKTIKNAIDTAEIVSFDVFDTMLLRVVDSPEAVFNVIGNYFGMDNYREFRVNAQNESSTLATEKNGWPHPDYDGIYDYIKGLSSTPYDEQDIDWDEVKAKELELEFDGLVENPEIKSIYKYAKSQNKRIIAITDMYLDAAFVERALKKNGYEVSAIYDSANIHKTKWTGELYSHVSGIEGVSTAHIVHIGDNPSSDYDIPRSQGIVAFHYKGGLGRANYRNPEDGEGGSPSGLDPSGTGVSSTSNASMGVGASSYIGQGIADIIYRSEDNFWTRLGARVGGPLYLGLMQWLNDNLSELPAKRKIYFMSRDGYNLYKLYEQFTDEDVCYMYTSRRALLLGGITALDGISLQLLPPFTYGQTIKDVLDYIDMIDIYEDCIGELGYESLDDIITEDDVKYGHFRKLYQLKEHEFLAKCALEREHAKKYLESIGFYDEDSVVFDCGWNGSSQFLLERLLDATGYNDGNYNYKFFYTGILDTDKSRMQLSHSDYKAFLFDYDDNRALQNRVREAIVLLELFFGSPEQSIYRYEEDGPKFDESDVVAPYKKDLLSGITKFLEYGYNFAEKYNIKLNRQSATAELMRFIEEPTLEEATVVGNLSNDDTFAKREGVDVKLGFITEEQYEANINIDTFWIQGFLKRDDVSLDLKKKVCKDKEIDINRYIPIDEDITVNMTDEERAYKAAADKAGYEARPYTRWFNLHYSKKEPYVKQEYEPLISVVVPVYNVADNMLRECIDSVINQTYPHWELWLVDDFSTMESVRDVLRSYEDKYKDRDDINLNVIYRQENGHISVATNDGIFAATGEFIAFMDCDDLIEITTFAEMVYYLNKHPDTDFIYTDEDKVSEDGTDLHNPFFKPDWSPDTMMSMMYTNHLAIYRRELVIKTGGLRTEFNGSQDYDFTMRFMELSDNKRVGHIPRVLYHWRERKESVASGMGAKPYVISAMQRLKEETLKRRGIEGKVYYDEDVFQHHVDYLTPGDPLVSIIIPSKDNYFMLSICMESLDRYTAYPNYEIIVVDNGSNEVNKNKISAMLASYGAQYIYKPMDFNFSKMCNIGAEHAKGQYLLFLNDDVEALNKNWLGKMVGQAMLKHTGAVGAKLLYPNSTIIQHIGIANLQVGPCHMYMGTSDVPIFYFGRNRMTYNWLAVTGACLMVSTDKYNEIGGFDENLTVAYNDVDLCFNLYEAGYYNVVRPDVSLYHHESFSRGYDDISDEKKKRLKNERDILYNKHPDLFAKDPFHNVNFGVDRIDYDIDMYGVGVHNYDLSILSDSYEALPTTLNIGIDEILKDDMARIRGWAFSDDPMRDLHSKRYILLKNKAGQVYSCPVDTFPREDVSEQFGVPNLSEGFECNIDRKLLATHLYSYKIGLLQVNQDGSKMHIWSDKELPHDGIEDVPYKIYNRRISLNDMTCNEEIMANLDSVKYDTRVVTKYGSFNDMTYLQGWALIPRSKTINYRIEVGVAASTVESLSSGVRSGKASDDAIAKSPAMELVLYDTTRDIRYDVSNSITNSMTYLSGFTTEIPLKLESGSDIYIVITDMITGQSSYKKIVVG